MANPQYFAGISPNYQARAAASRQEYEAKRGQEQQLRAVPVRSSQSGDYSQPAPRPVPMPSVGNTRSRQQQPYSYGGMDDGIFAQPRAAQRYPSYGDRDSVQSGYGLPSYGGQSYGSPKVETPEVARYREMMGQQRFGQGNSLPGDRNMPIPFGGRSYGNQYGGQGYGSRGSIRTLEFSKEDAERARQNPGPSTRTLELRDEDIQRARREAASDPLGRNPYEQLLGGPSMPYYAPPQRPVNFDGVGMQEAAERISGNIAELPGQAYNAFSKVYQFPSRVASQGLGDLGGIGSRREELRQPRANNSGFTQMPDEGNPPELDVRFTNSGMMDFPSPVESGMFDNKMAQRYGVSQLPSVSQLPDGIYGAAANSQGDVTTRAPSQAASDNRYSNYMNRAIDAAQNAGGQSLNRGREMARQDAQVQSATNTALARDAEAERAAASRFGLNPLQQWQSDNIAGRASYASQNVDPSAPLGYVPDSTYKPPANAPWATDPIYNYNTPHAERYGGVATPEARNSYAERFDPESAYIASTTPEQQQMNTYAAAESFLRTPMAEENRQAARRQGQYSPVDNLGNQNAINGAFNAQKQASDAAYEANRQKNLEAKAKSDAAMRAQGLDPDKERRESATLNAQYYNYIRASRAGGTKPVSYTDFAAIMKGGNAPQTAATQPPATTAAPQEPAAPTAAQAPVSRSPMPLSASTSVTTQESAPAQPAQAVTEEAQPAVETKTQVQAGTPQAEYNLPVNSEASSATAAQPVSSRAPASGSPTGEKSTFGNIYDKAGNALGKVGSAVGKAGGAVAGAVDAVVPDALQEFPSRIFNGGIGGSLAGKGSRRDSLRNPNATPQEPSPSPLYQEDFTYSGPATSRQQQYGLPTTPQLLPADSAAPSQAPEASNASNETQSPATAPEAAAPTDDTQQQDSPQVVAAAPLPQQPAAPAPQPPTAAQPPMAPQQPAAPVPAAPAPAAPTPTAPAQNPANDPNYPFNNTQPMPTPAGRNLPTRDDLENMLQAQRNSVNQARQAVKDDRERRRLVGGPSLPMAAYMMNRYGIPMTLGMPREEAERQRYIESLGISGLRPASYRADVIAQQQSNLNNNTADVNKELIRANAYRDATLTRGLADIKSAQIQADMTKDRWKTEQLQSQNAFDRQQLQQALDNHRQKMEGILNTPSTNQQQRDWAELQSLRQAASSVSVPLPPYVQGRLNELETKFGGSGTGAQPGYGAPTPPAPQPGVTGTQQPTVPAPQPGAPSNPQTQYNLPPSPSASNPIQDPNQRAIAFNNLTASDTDLTSNDSYQGFSNFANRLVDSGLGNASRQEIMQTLKETPIGKALSNPSTANQFLKEYLNRQSQYANDTVGKNYTWSEWQPFAKQFDPNASNRTYYINRGVSEFNAQNANELMLIKKILGEDTVNKAMQEHYKKWLYPPQNLK